MSTKQSQPEEKQLSVLILADNFKNTQKILNLLPCPFESSFELLLQLLERQGFRDIFVYSCRSRNSIGEYMAERNRNRPKRIQVILSEESTSFSSIIRDVYSKKIIKDDFVVLDSHVITEVDFVQLVQEFYRQKQANKGYLLLSVFQECKANSLSAHIVSYYKHSKIILHYEELCSYEPMLKDNERIQFSKLNEDQPKDLVQLSFTLVPTGIAILSKSALHVIYSLNEFQMSLQQFIKEIATSQISSEQIGLHVLDKQTYSQDIQCSSNFLRSCFD
jgi:translation initiation factor eIF-2B subunit epsilon